MACGENQIAADQDADAGPKWAMVIVVRTNPDLADSAVRIHAKTFIDFAFEEMLRFVLVVGPDFVDGFFVFGFLEAFRFVGSGARAPSSGEAMRLVTFVDIEASFFQLLFNVGGIQSDLCLTCLVWDSKRMTTMVGVRFVGRTGRIPVFFACLVLTRFRRI